MHDEELFLNLNFFLLILLLSPPHIILYQVPTVIKKRERSLPFCVFVYRWMYRCVVWFIF